MASISALFLALVGLLGQLATRELSVFPAPDRLRLRVASARPAGPLAPDNSELDKGLDQQASDILITKRKWGAFFGTDLDLQLRRRRVSGIVLAAIATSMGVESTARQAFEHGYNLTVAH